MYQTIVIGNDFSSLVAALTLAHRGKSTVLLREGNVPDYLEQSGYVFNIDPLPWTGFAPHGVSRRLMNKIGMPPVEHFMTLCENPAFQIIFSHHRIDLYNEIEPRRQELCREFKNDCTRVAKLFETITRGSTIVSKYIDDNPWVNRRSFPGYMKCLFSIPRFVWHRNALRKQMRAIERNIHLKRLLDAEALIFSNLETTGSNHSLSHAYTLTSSMKNLYYHSGGKHRLIGEMEDSFERKGGILLRGCSILRLHVDSDITADVMLCTETAAIRAKNMIVSAKWESIKSLLFNDSRFAKLEKKLKAATPTTFPFSVHIGVHDRGLPEKMAPHVMLIVDEAKPLANGNLIFLETSERGDTERAPSGKRAMSGTVFLSDSPLRLSDDVLKDLSENIVKDLEEFLPFLRENIDFLDISQSITASRNYQEVVNQKYTVDRASLLGIVPLGGKSSVKNVILTGGPMYGGLGFEGEVISGVNSANLMVGEG